MVDETADEITVLAIFHGARNREGSSRSKGEIGRVRIVEDFLPSPIYPL
jgi:hypothetical protein